MYNNKRENTNKIITLGHTGAGGQKGWVYSMNGASPTVPASTWKDPIKILYKKGIHNMNKENENNIYRIRKLTPTECWKLMGMTKEDVEKARAVGLSNSQLYKQAGNGLVTNCISLLMEHLYKSQYNETYKCSDENFTQPQMV